MKTKKLRIEQFLHEMDQGIPWEALEEIIAPYYKSTRGRRPHALRVRLRIHLLQLWHNLSDPLMEEAWYDRLSFQSFLGFDCFGGMIPAESRICRVRHLLEEHGLSQQILDAVNAHLDSKGLVLKAGTIVDATWLAAPVSKNNQRKEREPEMSSPRKTNTWHFEAKGHIGVQAQGHPIIHSAEFSTAKVHDSPLLEELQHGEEPALLGDSASSKQADKHQARADEVYYGIADRGARQHPLSSSQKKRNHRHASIRAKVEHPLRIIKHLWGHTKLRDKGLAKNAAQVTRLCALSNVFVCRRTLLQAA